jgi:hypothetical protein
MGISEARGQKSEIGEIATVIDPFSVETINYKQ